MIRPDLAKLPAYIPGKSIQDALKLSSNEISQGPLPSVIATVEKTIGTIQRYPDMGALQLRSAIAEQWETPITVDHVAVGCGSSALCLQIIQATSTPDSEVIFAWRSFEAYPILTQIVGATPVPIPLDENHRHDLSAMIKAITDKTSLIFICNPNNPTGTTITEEEFTEFMAQVPSRVTVVLDEAYVEYQRNNLLPSAQLLNKWDNLVICRTFSKAYGLAGARVGYMIAAPVIIEAVNKVAIPFSVNSFAQAAAIASLREKEELEARVEETNAQRQRAMEAFPSQWRVESEANFLWIPHPTHAPTITNAFAQHNILVRCFPEGVRVTITTKEETNTLITALPTVLQTIDPEKS